MPTLINTVGKVSLDPPAAETILASLPFSSLAKTWGERITVALQPGAAG